MQIVRYSLLTLTFLLACSSASNEGAPTGPSSTDIDASDAGTKGDAPVDAPPSVPLVKPTFPTMKSLGGPVIKAPKIQPIFYKGDPKIPVVEGFLAKLASGTYWSDVTSEYGIGPLSVKKSIVIDEAAPTMIYSDDIDSSLKTKLLDPKKPFGAEDPETNYLFIFPAATSVVQRISGELGGTSCVEFGGYHYEVATSASTKVGEAVIPRCTFAGVADDDILTTAISHELVEWASDPFPVSDPAFAEIDDDHLAWTRFAQYATEMSDLCTLFDREELKPADLGFVVQRHWSTTLAQKGTFPCAPRSARKLYLTFPEADDPIKTVTYDRSGSSVNGTREVTARGIKVPVGGSRTVKVHHYAEDVGRGSWIAYVVSEDKYHPDLPPSLFKYSLNTKSGKVGEEAELTITAPKSSAQEIMIFISRESMTGEDAFTMPVLVSAE